MCELGNTVINRIYEARIDEITIKKPHPSSPRCKQSTPTNVHTLKGLSTDFTHMQFSSLVTESATHSVKNGTMMPHVALYSHTQ